MSKPKLTKQQAEAIEYAKENKKTHYVIKTIASPDTGFSSSFMRYNPLDKLPLKDICLAFYVGYEVEKTPEEELKDYYEFLKDNEEFSKLKVIRETLEILGIKVEGVSVNE